MINTLINDLKISLKIISTLKQFHLIKDLNLSEKDLEKYDHRNETTYTRNLIHREKDFEIMLVCWPPHVSAPIHGHEGEKCWARVQTGELKICNYVEINRDPLSLEKFKSLNALQDFLMDQQTYTQLKIYQIALQLVYTYMQNPMRSVNFLIQKEVLLQKQKWIITA